MSDDAIDTFVPGVPSQVVTGADYLKPQLVDVTRDGESRLIHVNDLAAQHWYGESFDAYSSVSVQVRMALNEVNSRCHEYAEVLMAYAGQIGRMESDFADIRDRARDRGLTVDGALIHPPGPSLTPCPDPELDPHGYNAYQNDQAALVDWFNARATEVGTRKGELVVWIAEHLEPLVTGIPARGIAEILLEKIGDEGWSNAANLTVDGVELHWQTRLPEIEHRAADLAEAARQLDAYSGNREVMAARASAIAEGLGDSLNTRAGALDDVARVIRQNLQWLPFVGPVIDVVDAGVGLVQGESVADLAVEYGGGAVAAAIVSIAAAGLGGGGFLATVALPAAAVIGGSMFASWMYEEVVPLHVREGIDDSVEDFFEIFIETQSDPGQISY